jgi:hypothetical protein
MAIESTKEKQVHLKKIARTFRPIPNLKAYSSSAAARELISNAIPSDLSRKKKEQ